MSRFLSLLIVFIACNTSANTRIDRVINGLLPTTAIENRYDAPASLKDRMAHFHTPGVSIAVIDNFKIDWARAFGTIEQGKSRPVTTRTLFQAASISKAVFALGVMKLEQEGKLDLDEDVNQYLATWKVPASGSWQPRLTLRQLLSHTAGLTQSGFDGYQPGAKIPTLVDILNGRAPANSRPVVVNILPGMQWRYSGGGTTVAQQVIMDLLHKPFPKVMDELVLTPMGLRDSSYEQPLSKSWVSKTAVGHPRQGHPIPQKWHIYPEMAAAGLWTTPTDLAKIGIELQLALKGQSEKIISQKTITRMLAPIISTPGIDEQIGIGFFLSGKDENIRFGHNGSNEGFLALATFYKNIGKGAVIMINSGEGWPMIAELERAIALEYQWPGYFTEEKKAIAIAPEILRDLTGTYRSKSGVCFDIKSKNNELLLTLTNQLPITLQAESETKFFMRHLNTTVTFDKSMGSKAKSLTVVQEGSAIVAERSR